MTDIKRKALALLEDVIAKQSVSGRYFPNCIYHEAIEIAIEQHEAFKQEVSETVYKVKCYALPREVNEILDRFIIPKPKSDPMAEALKNMDAVMERLEAFRAALEARGLEIREKANAHSKTD